MNSELDKMIEYGNKLNKIETLVENMQLECSYHLKYGDCKQCEVNCKMKEMIRIMEE